MATPALIDEPAEFGPLPPSPNVEGATQNSVDPSTPLRGGTSLASGRSAAQPRGVRNASETDSVEAPPAVATNSRTSNVPSAATLMSQRARLRSISISNRSKPTSAAPPGRGHSVTSRNRGASALLVKAPNSAALITKPAASLEQVPPYTPDFCRKYLSVYACICSQRELKEAFKAVRSEHPAGVSPGSVVALLEDKLRTISNANNADERKRLTADIRRYREYILTHSSTSDLLPVLEAFCASLSPHRPNATARGSEDTAHFIVAFLYAIADLILLEIGRKKTRNNAAGATGAGLLRVPLGSESELADALPSREAEMSISGIASQTSELLQHGGGLPSSSRGSRPFFLVDRNGNMVSFCTTLMESTVVETICESAASHGILTEKLLSSASKLDGVDPLAVILRATMLTSEVADSILKAVGELRAYLVAQEAAIPAELPCSNMPGALDHIAVSINVPRGRAPEDFTPAGARPSHGTEDPHRTLFSSVLKKLTGFIVACKSRGKLTAAQKDGVTSLFLPKPVTVTPTANLLSPASMSSGVDSSFCPPNTPDIPGGIGEFPYSANNFPSFLADGLNLSEVDNYHTQIRFLEQRIEATGRKIAGNAAIRHPPSDDIHVAPGALKMPSAARRSGTPEGFGFGIFDTILQVPTPSAVSDHGEQSNEDKQTDDDSDEEDVTSQHAFYLLDRTLFARKLDQAYSRQFAKVANMNQASVQSIRGHDTILDEIKKSRLALSIAEEEASRMDAEVLRVEGDIAESVALWDSKRAAMNEQLRALQDRKAALKKELEEVDLKITGLSTETRKLGMLHDRMQVSRLNVSNKKDTFKKVMEVSVKLASAKSELYSFLLQPAAAASTALQQHHDLGLHKVRHIVTQSHESYLRSCYEYSTYLADQMFAYINALKQLQHWQTNKAEHGDQMGQVISGGISCLTSVAEVNKQVRNFFMPGTKYPAALWKKHVLAPDFQDANVPCDDVPDITPFRTPEELEKNGSCQDTNPSRLSGVLGEVNSVMATPCTEHLDGSAMPPGVDESYGGFIDMDVWTEETASSVLVLPAAVAVHYSSAFRKLFTWFSKAQSALAAFAQATATSEPLQQSVSLPPPPLQDLGPLFQVPPISRPRNVNIPSTAPIECSDTINSDLKKTFLKEHLHPLHATACQLESALGQVSKMSTSPVRKSSISKPSLPNPAPTSSQSTTAPSASFRSKSLQKSRIADRGNRRT